MHIKFVTDFCGAFYGFEVNNPTCFRRKSVINLISENMGMSFQKNEIVQMYKAAANACVRCYPVCISVL